MFEPSWVTPYLAIGPRLDSAAWAVLERTEITLVIDLNDDPFERHQAQRLDIRYRGLKVSDPTELEEFQSAFPRIHELIETERTAGGKVYLHCTAGVYRSPTFAMAHLISKGKTGIEAENMVKKAHGPTWTSGDIETLQRALHLWEMKQRGAFNSTGELVSPD